ncbi:MAG: hypothetical protein ACI9OD_002014 [Limisphaerales bacterium]
MASFIDVSVMDKGFFPPTGLSPPAQGWQRNVAGAGATTGIAEVPALIHNEAIVFGGDPPDRDHISTISEFTRGYEAAVAMNMKTPLQAWEERGASVPR